MAAKTRRAFMTVLGGLAVSWPRGGLAPRLWHRSGWTKNLARIVSLIAVLLSASTVAMLLLLNPPTGCPGWSLPWLLLTWWTVPFLAINCFIALRWSWCVRQAAEADTAMLLPVEYVLTRMCIVGATGAQLPLFFVLACQARY